jgi:Ankyrin repeats (3 copies)/Ankyrin repeat
MSEQNKKSLVERYYTWEKLVLVTALLLIFWQIFGLNDATSLPFVDVKLRDPSKFPLVTSIILAIQFLFLRIEWNQSEKIAQHTFIARFRFAITVVLAIAAVWVNLPSLTKGTALAEISRLWFVFYFFIGLAIGALTSVLVFVTLMIHSDEESAKSPLMQIPIATRCVYIGCWPIVFILLLVSYAVSCRAPLAVLQIAPWITALPISYFVIQKLIDLFFFYDAHGHRVPVRQRISQFKEIFKMHDYLLYVNRHGGRLSTEVEIPPNATPQKIQQLYRKHIVKNLSEEKAQAELSLHEAAFAGRQDEIEGLLAKGKNINEQSGPGWTPLLAAVAQGHAKIAKFMLERGANPDIANLQKITPLMYAARYGNLEIAKMLLDFGASLDLQDIYGETALAVAVREGQESLVKLFLSKGANIDTRTTLEKLTPLESAHQRGYGKIARLLRKAKK